MHNKILIVYVYILFFLLVYINVYDLPLTGLFVESHLGNTFEQLPCNSMHCI